MQLAAATSKTENAESLPSTVTAVTSLFSAARAPLERSATLLVDARPMSASRKVIHRRLRPHPRSTLSFAATQYTCCFVLESLFLSGASQVCQDLFTPIVATRSFWTHAPSPHFLLPLPSLHFLLLHDNLNDPSIRSTPSLSKPRVSTLVPLPPTLLRPSPKPSPLPNPPPDLLRSSPRAPRARAEELDCQAKGPNCHCIKDCEGSACNAAGGNPCASKGVCCCAAAGAGTYADACPSCGDTSSKPYSGNTYCAAPLGAP